MTPQELRDLLTAIQAGTTSIDDGLNQLRRLDILDLGFARIDTHRAVRTGYGEVIFCLGKTREQVSKICSALLARGEAHILATRADEELYESIRELCPHAVYHRTARAITITLNPVAQTATYIAIVSAGTSDLAVAEEAAVTAEFFGNRVVRIYDVGVAGVHRLFHHLELIRGGRVCIVVAGMDGALPSLVGGLVGNPVIAVPTSIGYGASFQGVAALLAMLNSCAGGITVVNIDNGFGAGLAASKINALP